MVSVVLDKNKHDSKCSHNGCSGTIIESQGEAVCMACGRPARVVPVQKKPSAPPAPTPVPPIKTLPPVPPKPKGDPSSVARYYDEHRLEIEQDVAKMGTKGALNKWGIASGTWTGIRRRWESGKPGETKPKISEIKVKSVPQLPPFPPFSNEWNPEVQILWLNMYLELKRESKDAK